LRKEILISSLLAIIGIVFLVGGASAFFIKSGTTVVCEACGMEIERDDPSKFQVVCAGEPHFACCPVCGLVVGIYYINSSVEGQCFACGRVITVSIINENLSSVTPTGGAYNVSMIFGQMCMKNKMVCSNNCANTVKNSYEWAADLPVKTMDQTFSIAKIKYQQMTVGYKPLSIPMLTYVLVAVGIILLLLSPASWALMKRRPP